MEKETLNRAAPAKPHTFLMDNRKKAELTGVSEVLSFDENQVSLLTDCGEISLTGENLHVTALMLEEGKMTVEGKVDSVFYLQPARRSGWLSRKKK